ncbi:hypothetical protein LTR62_008628 [Meristemomyces frigidus]|uniref:Uncharacterized protein n=1 Tax=Meristemomyces frigidus TaxID=1508187 RepID=A0AAN7YN58_9PEZI|nr:hypothetical protein LTR62_008628 [Meristemomyces frigidus]
MQIFLFFKAVSLHLTGHDHRICTRLDLPPTLTAALKLTSLTELLNKNSRTTRSARTTASLSAVLHRLDEQKDPATTLDLHTLHLFETKLTDPLQTTERDETYDEEWPFLTPTDTDSANSSYEQPGAILSAVIQRDILVHKMPAVTRTAAEVGRRDLEGSTQPPHTVIEMVEW